MGALDRAVLVRDAAIVARRHHAVMGAQLLIAAGEVLLGITMRLQNAADRIRAVSVGRPRWSGDSRQKGKRRPGQKQTLKCSNGRAS